MTTSKIITEILDEIDRQDEKWGKDRDLHKYTWVTVLTEEVGEIANAALEKDDENYKEECIQVGALIFQMLKREE